MFSLASLAVPVIQAPMAGGPNTPRQVAIVAERGGVGSFGFAYASPDRIASDLGAAMAQTRGPINANFFVFGPVMLPDASSCAASLAALGALPIAAGLDLGLPAPPFTPDLAAQLEPVWALRPAILSFHLGVPPDGVVARAHDLAIAVALSATSPAEARAAERAGADVIVAQGIEAGGHRGLFDPGDDDAALPVRDLIAALRPVVSRPLVAAGGIMTGADIADMRALGAAAAQMGTAFLTCAEGGATPAHRRLLLSDPDRGTDLTRAYSGRPARGLRTAFMTAMAEKPGLCL